MTHWNICFDICFAFSPPLFHLICLVSTDSHSCVIRQSLSAFTSSLPPILFLLKVSRVWSCHVFVFFLRVSITLFPWTTQTTYPHCTAAVAGKPRNLPFYCFDLQLECWKSSNKVMDLNNFMSFRAGLINLRSNNMTLHFQVTWNFGVQVMRQSFFFYGEQIHGRVIARRLNRLVPVTPKTTWLLDHTSDSEPDLRRLLTSWLGWINQTTWLGLGKLCGLA